MAQLRDTNTKRSFSLRTHHTIGRCAERSDTVVSSPITSRIHLSMEWDGDHWNVRDLSKNGTWLGAKRLQPNESVPVRLGDTIHVGAPDMPPLEFIDDQPPSSGLIATTDDTPDLPLEPFIFLPSADNPQAVLIYSYHRHSWLLHPMEHDNVQSNERVIHHGDYLRYGGHEWQVFLAETEQVTEINIAPEKKLEDIEFIFDLSRDEENTGLQLQFGSKQVNLGERSHHYLLMHLARIRAADAGNGYDQKTQGWIDNEQLKKDLGMDMPHINIMIFRARKQITENLEHTLDSDQLIERGKGRMRFGSPKFRIFKGESLAYALPSADASVR
ncbi:FHA domain-containing protein [Halioglobus maricola]|uniref:FHA domain-containing protein n=1 Tax=Halioglobus maricola TaxID=2601894 RepID=A0A5P9NJQ6_9GAMM|nr:FHA domain-containing protein [Halioglobus maricola]QFU75962.1 FHA domain-containing protein [Halioglobus maricola]